jgi:hypothetical protein
VSEAYIKKITVACPADTGDAGRLTLVANKCSILRNAPGRLNMHPPRWCWYTNPRRQQVLHCPKCPWPNEYASAQTLAPIFFPDLSSTTAAFPSFPIVAHMSHYADSSGGACARSRVQGCWSSRNHSIYLDPVDELSISVAVAVRASLLVRLRSVKKHFWHRFQGGNRHKISFKHRGRIIKVR